MLLWRNKKISVSVLSAATVVWVLFEWLNYHFLSLLCFVLVIGMFIQFVWSNASGVLKRWKFKIFKINFYSDGMVLLGLLLKYRELFYQRSFLATLVLRSVPKLTVSWGLFKIFQLEETSSISSWYVSMWNAILVS